MLSITLNIITIIIVLVVVGLLFRLYTDKKSKTDTETVSSDLKKNPSNSDEGEVQEVTASDVIYDTVTDPLVVSRAYFTETGYGELGDFKGLQAQLSNTYWIHGKLIPASE
jgi:hypothetical protein|tara:strand:- start:1710 stop:2042 length:333 start_codon:yes stop_codon:yes gene_type:complete